MKTPARIVVSNTYLSSFEKVVDDAIKLSEKDKFENIVFVVPDGFSLNAEQLLFAHTKRQSFFNIWTTTLSRLVSKVLKNDDKNYAVLTKNTGIMLVSKILLENQDKISTYKKLSNKYSLAEKMFNAINLLKSSGVRPEELLQNFDDSNFGLKIKDIFVVYSEYEKQMAKMPDKITRLEIFDKKVRDDEYIKNSHIFFAHFDSFTNAQLETLTNLAKYAKSFEIGLCANTFQKNAWIYDNVVFQRVISTFKEKSLPYEIENANAHLSSFSNHILKNMFAFEEAEQFETNAISLFECENVDEEVQNTASYIKYLLLEKKYQFDDINVAVCGLGDYQNSIDKIFKEFDFSFYIDKQRDLMSHFFAKALCKIFDFVCGQNSIADCVAIAKSPIFDFDQNAKDCFENYLIKYNVFASMIYKSFKKENSQDELLAESVRTIFDHIKIFAEDLSNCQTVSEYVDALNIFLQKIDAEQKIQNFAKKEIDLVQNSVDEQVFEKFSQILSDASNMFCDVKMTKEMFFEMLKNNMKSTNLKTVPLVCDSVFVGDASKSTFSPKKVLFVLGASQTRMPVYQNDSGTITDAEIGKFVSNRIITPTISELNKREKFKLFNLLLQASENLVLSFSTVTNGGVENKSEFVSALQKLFKTDGKTIGIRKAKNNYLLLEKNPELSAYVVGSFLNALKISEDGQNETLKKQIEINLQNMIEREKNYYIDKNKFQVSDVRKALFKNNRTSISQIESYFSCPFKQFLTYAVKPQDKPKFELKPYEIGDIFHRIAQSFVNLYKTDSTIDENIAEKLIVEIVSEPKYERIRENKIVYKNLLTESKRFCMAIKHQIESGNYKPYATEWRFENYKLDNNLNIKGFVDRIDVCQNDNSIRIIDYKTGNQDFDFSDYYYGKKLQLIMYLKIASEMLGKKPASAMYMPVRNSFDGKNENILSSYMLDGVLLDEDLTRENFDKEIKKNSKSDIIKVRYKKDGGLQSRSLSTSLDSKQMLDLQNYCFKIANMATKEMLDGNLMPKPYKDGGTSCDYCQFRAICQYNLDAKGYRKITTKNKTSFSKNSNQGEKYE